MNSHPISITASFLFLSIGGCTLLSPDNELRVTEYGGDGSYLMQASGQVAGCRVVQAGATQGCLTVKTKTCRFTSAGCAPR